MHQSMKQGTVPSGTSFFSEPRTLWLTSHPKACETIHTSHGNTKGYSRRRPQRIDAQRRTPIRWLRISRCSLLCTAICICYLHRDHGTHWLLGLSPPIRNLADEHAPRGSMVVVLVVARHSIYKLLLHWCVYPRSFSRHKRKSDCLPHPLDPLRSSRGM